MLSLDNILNGSPREQARKAGIPDDMGFRREIDQRTGKITITATEPLRTASTRRAVAPHKPQPSPAARQARHAQLRRTMGRRQVGTREQRYERLKQEHGHPDGVVFPSRSIDRLRLK